MDKKKWDAPMMEALDVKSTQKTYRFGQVPDGDKVEENCEYEGPAYS